jgi:hypothetical protein
VFSVLFSYFSFGLIWDILGIQTASGIIALNGQSNNVKTAS